MPRYEIYRDPALLADGIPAPTPGLRLALGLDLGTSTGMAAGYFRPGEPFVVGRHPIVLGQLDLSAGSYDSGAIRFVRLRQYLSVLAPAIVFYERVRYVPEASLTRFNVSAIMARAATACEWFGALMACVSTWSEENRVPCVGLPIQHLKKRATGRGNCNKADMVKACNETFGVAFDPETYEQTGVDNTADAAFCLLTGLEQYALGVSVTGQPVTDEAKPVGRRKKERPAFPTRPATRQPGSGDGSGSETGPA